MYNLVVGIVTTLLKVVKVCFTIPHFRHFGVTDLGVVTFITDFVKIRQNFKT